MNDESAAAMESPSIDEDTVNHRARLWPLVVAMLIQCILFTLSVTPSINNASRFLMMMVGPLIGAIMLLTWIAAACRLPRRERLLTAAVVVGLIVITSLTVHDTTKLALFLYGVPLTTLAWLSASVLGGTRSQLRQTLTLTFSFAVWAVFPILRVDGYDGQYFPELSLRWSPTPEERLLKEVAAKPSQPSAEWAAETVEWPEFRGPDRNSRAAFDGRPLNWTEERPRELWRQPIGPGWSSLIYVSGRLFTQEQRGSEEAVTCYDADTGELIWMHADEQRFSDVVSGAGPRATPTFHDGQLFVCGSKGLLCCLNAADGSPVWQRDLMQEFGAQLPVWGFANSPLVTDDAVITYVGGSSNHGLMAFNRENGNELWSLPAGGMNFSSAQAAVIDENPQVIFGDGNKIRGVNTSTGAELWKFTPSTWNGPNVCQPQMVGDSEFVIPIGDGKGVTRLSVSRNDEGWKVTEQWLSNRLKPSFNDFVYFDGYLYGFDQSILVCLDAETGERKWKGGRYGFGQMILLEATGQIIVLSEFGDLILLKATPEAHTELGRFNAIEGKTWNHPTVVGRRLFVRNGEEMAAFLLTE